MWYKLQCDYYVELLVNTIIEIVEKLEDKNTLLESIDVSLINCYHTASILQNLILKNIEDKLLDKGYITLIKPLIELKLYLKSICPSELTVNSNCIVKDLLSISASIATINEKNKDQIRKFHLNRN